MDVITVLQPENHLSSRRASPLQIYTQTRKPDISFGGDLSDLSILKHLVSVPVLFILIALISLAITPLFQERYGWYRLAPLTFAGDMLAESSLRRNVLPDSELVLQSEGTMTEVPAMVMSVVYSSYTVKPGDTISAIVSRFALRNISSILSVNSIDNARRIRSGQTLSIPSIDGIMHTVVRGDSLTRVSERYSVSVTAILDANDLDNATLTAGQRLFIPGAALSNLELRKAMGELFIAPIHGRLTSKYGYRKDPFTSVRSFHTGIDLAAPTGTIIKAALDGKVATTGYSPVYGNYVIITHDGGYQTLYGHMSSISVKRSQRIVQGSTVGRVGNTGYSTGSHLHFSVYKSGKTIDPYSVLK